MRIENRTKWRTEDLRFMIGQALRERGVPSKGLCVVVKVARTPAPFGRAAHGFWRGRLPTEAIRPDGSAPNRIFVFGDEMSVSVQNPPCDFDPASTEHVERVVALARVIDFCAVTLAGQWRSSSWESDPVAWLSDWFEVNRGVKGVAAGCPVSPLLPAIEKHDRALAQQKKIAHAEMMWRRAFTRLKRSKTLEAKWARRVAALKRQARK
jgi:hypothetical protein